jgi:3-oxoadipate enol-lactonase
MMAAVDLTAQYASIQVPTLVIGAKYDSLRPPAMAEQVAQSLSDATYLLADSGHFINVQTPQLFADTLLAFLTQK